MKPYRIYVASSWKSQFHDLAVKHLRGEGFEVYDYRQDGFSWNQIDPDWDLWDAHRAVTVLDEPVAAAHYYQDFKALDEAHGVLLILPCGLSAGLEAGYAVGQRKNVITWVPSIREPELMLKLTDEVAEHIFEVVAFFHQRAQENNEEKPESAT